jgi:DNA repair protein RadC
MPKVNAFALNERPMSEVCPEERPQERMERHGPGGLKDSELLAMVLRSGTAGSRVLGIANQLLHEAGSLGMLLKWTHADYRKIRGIGRVKSLQLASLMEIARRVQSDVLPQFPLMKEPSDIARFLRPNTLGLDVEKLWVLSLNTRGRLIRCAEISSGTATASLVHPREVFREALRVSATGVAVVHNHPSGDPQPSSADLAVTRQLKEAARIIGIEFIDHVIIGREECDPAARGWFSFKNSGLV